MRTHQGATARRWKHGLPTSEGSAKLSHSHISMCAQVTAKCKQIMAHRAQTAKERQKLEEYIDKKSRCCLVAIACKELEQACASCSPCN